MALTNDPVFVQVPKTIGITFGGTSQSVEMDPATVGPTSLLTAGSDGALVTHIQVTAETTVLVEKIVLWVRPGGAGNWYVVRTGVLPAYTQSTDDEQSAVALVDKEVPTQAIRLAANDVLGITHHIDQHSMVVAEYTDF